MRVHFVLHLCMDSGDQLWVTWCVLQVPLLAEPGQPLSCVAQTCMEHRIALPQPSKYETEAIFEFIILIITIPQTL